MGNSQPPGSLGKKSTCLDVLNHFNVQKGSLAGKVAIVTGGHSGIGLETVRTLTHTGCKVISGGRSISAATAAMKAANLDLENVTVLELDLESLPSIKAFSDKCLQEPRIDYLVLNAGIMALPNLEYTPHDFEKQIGTNHYGHFYLTSLLLDKLKHQDFPSRIVSVSSRAHLRGVLDLKDLHFKNGRPYTDFSAYGQSKGANILFIKELADQLNNTKIACLSLHPGVIKTNLARHINPILSTLFLPFVVDKTPDQGASTTITALLDPSLDSAENRGSYLSDCAISSPNEHWSDADKSLRQGLWKITQEEINDALAKTASSSSS